SEHQRGFPTDSPLRHASSDKGRKRGHLALDDGARATSEVSGSRDQEPTTSSTIVSIGSTASRGSFTTTPKSCSENSAARPVPRKRALRTLAPSDGSNSDASVASSTCTNTRLPLRVVTPHG